MSAATFPRAPTSVTIFSPLLSYCLLFPPACMCLLNSSLFPMRLLSSSSQKNDRVWMATLCYPSLRSHSSIKDLSGHSGKSIKYLFFSMHVKAFQCEHLFCSSWLTPDLWSFGLQDSVAWAIDVICACSSLLFSPWFLFFEQNDVIILETHKLSLLIDLWYFKIEGLCPKTIIWFHCSTLSIQ